MFQPLAALLCRGKFLLAERFQLRVAGVHQLARLGHRLLQTDRRDDIFLHQTLDAVYLYLRHLQLGLGLFVMGLRLFHLLVQFRRGKLEKHLSFLHMLALIYKDGLHEPFHFRFHLHELYGLYIRYIRLRHLDRGRG